MPESTVIARERIRRDGGTQPRAAIVEHVVADYAEAIAAGASLPDVTVFYDGKDYWLADGFHRDAAHERLGLAEISCDVRAGTRRDAVLFACGANEAHGLRRTNEDKRRAVFMLLDDEEWRSWSDSEIARRARVSHTFVAKLRPVTCNVSSERTFTTKHGETATMDVAAIGRRAADLATARTLDAAVLYRLEAERRALKQAAKKERRSEREVALGNKIAAANAALPAMVAAGKRYGFILEDSEWPWESWSEETGMDRAEENHYPTSSLAEICARPIGDLAADDCVYALWATPSRLLMAIEVMKARGFTYRTNRVWRKLLPGQARGRGYWFHFTHELVLIGTRGNPPCPAMGEQWDSVFEAPRGRNSEKPPSMHEWAERFFPSVPKLECNARQAWPGWDVWGAEAPEAAEPAAEEAPAEVTESEPAAKPAPKARKSKAPKRDSWAVEREERAARIDRIAAGLPDDLAALTAAYGEAIDQHHDAVMRESAEDAWPMRERMEAILYKANGCTSFGVGCNDAPMSIRRANWAPVGTVPKWGQVGQFILEHRDIRAIICFGDHEGIHAPDFNRPFPSETGFHSIGATRTPGMSVEDYGRAMIDGSLAYVPGGGKGKPRKPVRPANAYQLARDERGYLRARERGPVIDKAAPPAGLDVAALDSILTRWREEDRARLMGKKGKRSLPESVRPDSKIIAIDGAMLTPLADFPETGTYVVSCFRWDGDERVEGWRYVADAAALDVATAPADPTEVIQ